MTRQSDTGHAVTQAELIAAAPPATPGMDPAVAESIRRAFPLDGQYPVSWPLPNIPDPAVSAAIDAAFGRP